MSPTRPLSVSLLRTALATLAGVAVVGTSVAGCSSGETGDAADTVPDSAVDADPTDLADAATASDDDADGDAGDAADAAEPVWPDFKFAPVDLPAAGTSLTLEELRVQLRHATCEWYRFCVPIGLASFADRGHCLAALERLGVGNATFNGLAESIADGAGTWDAAQAAACAATFPQRIAACGAFALRFDREPACAATFTGEASTAMPCARNADCSSGLCGMAHPACGSGYCALPADVDLPCDSDLDCGGPNRCADGACRSLVPGEPGDPCGPAGFECAPGVWCDKRWGAATCVPRLPLDYPCDPWGIPCKEALFCQPTAAENVGACRPRHGVGGPCTGDGWCQTGLACLILDPVVDPGDVPGDSPGEDRAEAPRICQPLPLPGEACPHDRCYGIDSHCVGPDLSPVCTWLPEADEACDSTTSPGGLNFECEPSVICDPHTKACAVPLPAGATCDNGDCGEHLSCFKGKCTGAIGEGKGCNGQSAYLCTGGTSCSGGKCKKPQCD